MKFDERLYRSFAGLVRDHKRDRTGYLARHRPALKAHLDTLIEQACVELGGAPLQNVRLAPSILTKAPDSLFTKSLLRVLASYSLLDGDNYIESDELALFFERDVAAALGHMCALSGESERSASGAGLLLYELETL